MAASKGHIEALLELLEAGADPTKADNVSVPKLCTHTHTHRCILHQCERCRYGGWAGGCTNFTLDKLARVRESLTSFLWLFVAVILPHVLEFSVLLS